MNLRQKWNYVNAIKETVSETNWVCGFPNVISTSDVPEVFIQADITQEGKSTLPPLPHPSNIQAEAYLAIPVKAGLHHIWVFNSMQLNVPDAEVETRTPRHQRHWS